MPINISHQGGGSASGSSFGSIFITTGVYFGTASTNGAWFITTSGNNLVFQRRESGVYVEKAADTP